MTFSFCINWMRRLNLAAAIRNRCEPFPNVRSSHIFDGFSRNGAGNGADDTGVRPNCRQRPDAARERSESSAGQSSWRTAFCQVVANDTRGARTSLVAPAAGSAGENRTEDSEFSETASSRPGSEAGPAGALEQFAAAKAESGAALAEPVECVAG